MKTSRDLLTSNINAVKSLVAAVKGTIGPRGLDVMLVDEFGQPSCTNDGVEILSNLKVTHPISKLVSEALKAQESQVGDGTTSTAILIEAMLDSASNKIQSGSKVQKLCQGIDLATNELIKAFKENSKVADEPDLKNIIKISARGDEIITKLVLEAGSKITNHSCYDLSDYTIGSLGYPSQVIDGLFIKKKAHFSYKNDFKNIDCLIIEGPFEPEPISSEAISTNEGVKKLDIHVDQLLQIAENIVKSGVQAIFTNASMLPAVEEMFARENVFVLTHLKKTDIDNLIEASGAELTSRAKLRSLKLNQIKDISGKLQAINQIEELGGYSLIGSKSKQASIVVNADTQIVLDERKRICLDAVKAMQATLRSGYLIGEGVAEMNMIPRIKKYQQSFSEDYEISAGFDVVIDSMQSVFDQILCNAGLDPIQAKSQISFDTSNQFGIDLDNGVTIDLLEQGVLDPTEVKISAFKIASTIAIQILRINLIVQAK